MAVDQIVDACGWTLVHFVWQGAVLALILAAALWALPKAWADARYWIACSALAAMLAAVVATFTWQVNQPLSEAQRAPGATRLEVGSVLRPPVRHQGSSTDGSVRRPATPIGNARISQRESELRAGSIFAFWRARIVAWLSPCLPWMVAAWSCGAAFLSVRLGVNWQAVRQLQTSGVRLADARWVELLARTASVMGVRRSVQLLQSTEALAPLVMGALRPAIIVPLELTTGLSADEIRAILAHELAHIRRHDYLVNLLQSVVETLLFFHPAVWWASAAVRREREFACDRAAARWCDGGERYARALLAVETLRTRQTLAMAATGGSLLERVRRLTGQEPRTARAGGGGLAVAGMLLLAAGLLLAANKPVSAREEATKILASANGRQPDASPKVVGPEAGAELTDEEASALAVKAHQQAAGLTGLERFYSEMSFRYLDVATMTAETKVSLKNLRKALDEPVIEKVVEQQSTLAWDPQKTYLASYYPSLKSSDGSSQSHRQIFFGNVEEGWSREDYGGEPPRFYRRDSVEDFLKHSGLMAPQYFGVTPRAFWWGNNYEHNQGHSAVPPEMVTYVSKGREELGGEECDVVESKGRAERLWIGRESGRLRGHLAYIYQGRTNTEFYRHPVVERVAGRTFKSNVEYRDWYEATRDSLPHELGTELTKAWYESYFDEMARPAKLVVFSDYREIKPGVWLPLREIRSHWLHHEQDDDKYRYGRCEIEMTAAVTDADLSEKLAELGPHEGDFVQDQRDGVVIEYKWGDQVDDRHLAELRAAKREETATSQKMIDDLRAPMKELVGRPAPALPAEGWLGKRPAIEGEPYLIHFWATWCGPCKNDYELLKRVAKDRQVIGIHPAGVPAAEVEAAAKEAELNYPTLVAEAQDDGLVSGYPVKMYPYCVVVDREGKVTAHGSLVDVAQAFGDAHE